MRGDRQSDRQRTDCVSAQLLEFVLRPANVIEDRHGSSDEGLAKWRRQHAPGSPFEQRRAELSFELGEAARKGRLYGPEMAGRGAQALVLRDGDDVPKMVQLHGAVSGPLSAGRKR